jgi:hypothetical protein
MHQKREQNHNTSQHTCGLYTLGISRYYLLAYILNRKRHVLFQNVLRRYYTRHANFKLIIGFKIVMTYT